MQRAIGLYPGTFDPIHQGHIVFALHAIQACQLDQVVFLPEPKPRNKPQATPIGERMAHLRSIVAQYPGLSALELPAERFTVNNTMSTLLSEFRDCRLFLLIGSDVALHSLQYWDEVSELLQVMRLIIGMRLHDNQSAVVAALSDLQEQLDVPLEYMCITTTHAGMSSSQIRATRQP